MSINYIPRLDGIRFVAIMSVIIAHFASSIGKHFSAAFYGVNLFFVLSGFLITSILISGKNDFKKSYFNFIIRRALRIFPAYYLTVLILVLIGSEGINSDLPYVLTYSYNYFIDYSKPLPPHVFFWSLAVEEQFYLIFPFIVLLLRNNIRLLQMVLLVIIIFAFTLVYFDLFGLKIYNYVGLHVNMAPLTIGAMGAILNKQSVILKGIFNNLFIELFLFLLLLYVLTTQPWNIQIIISSLINLYLIIKASYFKFNISLVNKFLENKFISHIGKVSYGIYLFHGMIGVLVADKLFNPIWESIPFDNFYLFSFLKYWDWIFRLFFVTFFSYLAASLSYYTFEIQFLKLKNKYFNK
jgi:peptidoglycan/LPS O-acetylase OafA/YrhL